MTTSTLANSEIDLEPYYRIRAYVLTLASARVLWTKLRTFEKQALGGTWEHCRDSGCHNAIQIWRRLKNVSHRKAVVQVGVKIGLVLPDDADGLLESVGEIVADPAEAQAQAIKRGDLVIERSSKSVYWNGELIEAAWPPGDEAWDFWVVACEHAQRNQPIDRWSFGDRARANVVTQKKSRLKAVPGFPSELIAFLKLAGTGTQRFAFPAERVHIF